MLKYERHKNGSAVGLREAVLWEHDVMMCVVVQLSSQ